MGGHNGQVTLRGYDNLTGAGRPRFHHRAAQAVWVDELTTVRSD